MNEDERGFIIGNIILSLLGTTIILVCYDEISLSMVTGFVSVVVLVVNSKMSKKKEDVVK